MITVLKKRKISSLLGLSFDGKRLDGVWLRRTNGSASIEKAFSVVLSLDPLTHEPELVGREIRNHLDEAGVKERRCAVCVPSNWALTIQTKIPEMPEEDVVSFLQIEAERGFPYSLDALLTADSVLIAPNGEKHATQVAVPRAHLTRMETVLRAAKLRPVTFALGINAVQRTDRADKDSVLALSIGESGVALQISSGGGIAALRMLEGAIENEGGQKQLHANVIARECRITLGQLPSDIRESIHKMRVFGRPEIAQQFAGEIRSWAESKGMKVEVAGGYAGDDMVVKLPPDASISPALSFAARYLGGNAGTLELLPPRVSAWQQITSRYSSKKLAWAGAAAAAVLLIVASLFLYQQFQLSGLRSQWASMSPKVTELEGLQQQIRRYRPWFDQSLTGLTILRKVTEAFPEDGIVYAKTLEIRELSNVSCTGTAQDSQSLQRTLDKLRGVKEISDVKLDNIKGKSPMQFTLNFHWSEGGAQ